MIYLNISNSCSDKEYNNKLNAIAEFFYLSEQRFEMFKKTDFNYYKPLFLFQNDIIDCNFLKLSTPTKQLW